MCIIVCLCCVPAENSLMHFESEDKTSHEDFLLGRSLSQNRRKTERGASPTHYTLVPALQMEVSRSTSSSDSASLYHVSLSCPRKVKSFFVRIHTGIYFMCFVLISQVFERSSLLSRSKKKGKGRIIFLGLNFMCMLTCTQILI